MKRWRILLWVNLNSTTIKFSPSLVLRSTALYFLGIYYTGYRWTVEFPVLLLTLLQLQSYLVPCISSRIFIIPKLRNTCCRELISFGELFSLCIEHLPHCYSVSCSFFSFLVPDWNFRGHLSRALPTENIFRLLRSTHSNDLMRDYSAESMRDTLEIIVEWLQVSISECNRRQTPQTKNPICV